MQKSTEEITSDGAAALLAEQLRPGEHFAIDPGRRQVALGDEEETARANAEWIASGMAIAEINARRRTLSAIKGGKLAARVRGRAVTLVYSDVSAGALQDVASGPTLPGSEAVLVADNATLVRAAATTVDELHRGLRSSLAGIPALLGDDPFARVW